MHDILLFRTNSGPLAVAGKRAVPISLDWNDLFNRDSLYEFLNTQLSSTASASFDNAEDVAPLIPLEKQEIWAAGVTYFRSKTARMDESQNAGGGSFYDRVYEAQRPEIFFKANAARAVGHRDVMTLRSDSDWMVPEPELTLALNRDAKVVGYTIGNDLSCRDIEGENPLYLPQAKTFNGCASIGPGILVCQRPLPAETTIQLTIKRDGEVLVSDQTSLAQLKRSIEELVEYLFRDNTHPHGCFLMTGTGIVPPTDFSLQPGDEVSISIDRIGTLVNTVN